MNRGIEAYKQLRFAEAAQDFGKAVQVDTHSIQARLSLGVTYLSLYEIGLSEAHAKLFDVYAEGAAPGRSSAALDQMRTLIARQNSTNAARGEESFQQVLQIDPGNKLAMEYLAALYHIWLDPDDRPTHLDNAQHWYQRILEINPEHPFANYLCGVIDWEKAAVFMRSYGYPSPLPNEDARRSLHARISPLLDNGTANLLRSLEMDPHNKDAMTYLGMIKDAEAYMATAKDDRLRASSEADDWYRKAMQILEGRAQAAGQPSPASPRATFTFRRTPEDAKPTGTALPPFPPDPRSMIRPAPPPPPLPRVSGQ